MHDGLNVGVRVSHVVPNAAAFACRFIWYHAKRPTHSLINKFHGIMQPFISIFLTTHFNYVRMYKNFEDIFHKINSEIKGDSFF